MTLYERFKSLDIDFSGIGLIQREDNEGYFCTPKGAKIIGWAGVDGIHYCFIRRFGETVFAVSPMNGGEDNVHPLARNFEDFLRLLLSCRDLACMEQMWQWSRESFEMYVEKIELSEKTLGIFYLLRNQLDINPMEDPYAYMKELQAEFDYKSIPYTKEYYETIGEPCPDEKPADEEKEWKVYFESGFWGKHRGRDRAGEEIPLNKQFVWDDEIWHVPSVYSCGSGLVVDFCVRAEPEKIHAFREKWHLTADDDGEGFTRDEQIQIAQEHPLNKHFSAILTVNGRVMRQKRGFSLSWMPPSVLRDGEENSPESRDILAHYGLDETKGWSIHRKSFPWATKRKPVLHSVKVCLESGIISLFGPCFTSPEVGEKITFTHPITGAEHTLTVEEYTKQKINKSSLPDDMEFPSHYIMMVYKVTPALSDMKFSVCDCESNESPRRKPDVHAPSFGGASIGIIGGADGPTAIFFSQRHMDKPHAACSALRFEPTESVTWRIIFREKLRGDMEAELI